MNEVTYTENTVYTVFIVIPSLVEVERRSGNFKSSGACH